MFTNRFIKDKKNILIVADEDGDIDTSFYIDEHNCLVADSSDIILGNVLTTNYILLNDFDPDGLLHSQHRKNFNDILGKSINHYNHIVFQDATQNYENITKTEILVNEILSMYFIDSFYFISGYYNTDDTETTISVHVYSDEELPKEKIVAIETIVNLTFESNE